MDLDPICDVLTKYLPPGSPVLELSSGAGERVIELARRFPQHEWQPSDRDPQQVAAAIAARDAAGLPNLLRPIELDFTLVPWAISSPASIVAIDFAHVTPWDAVLAAFGGGAKALPSNGLFLLAGAFKIHGKYASKEHEELDQTLRSHDATHGLRDIREMTVAGTRAGLGLEHMVAMRGERFSLVFRRRPLLPPTGQFRVG